MANRTTQILLAALVGCAAATDALAQTVRVDAQEGAALPADVRQKIDAQIGKEPEPQSRFEARRQARLAADAALAILNSEGWFAADAQIDVDMGPPILPKVSLAPGPRFTFSDVGLHLEDTYGEIPDDIRLDLSPRLKTGQIARATEIIAEEKRIALVLRDAGYPDIEVLERSLTGDKDAATVALTYRLKPGARVCFGDLKLDGETRTRPVYLHHISPITPGEIYDAEKIDTLKSRLAESRLYALSQVALAPQGNVTETGCEVRDVTVSLQDAPRKTLALGASYATSEGPGLLADWDIRNWSGRADTVRAELRIAQLERTAGVSWEQPAFRGYGRKLTLGLKGSQEETDAYDLQALSINGLYDYRWTPRLSVTGGAGFQLVQETAAGVEKDLQIVSGLGGLRYDRTDDVLNPTQGFRAFSTVQPVYTLGDTEGPFATSSAEIRGYTGVSSDKIVFAGRLKVGSVFGAPARDIPVIYRFYSGGGGSVRGYAYQALGPHDADNNPTGGRSLVETSLEARWRFRKRFGAVAFVDGGNVYAAETPDFSGLRFGAGLGFRYYTSFGPLRFDVAAPLDRRPGDDPLQVYISIGQAF